MTTTEFDFRLSSLLTTYDRKQAGKRFYNPHALGIYFQAAERATELFKEGIEPRRALLACFNDRLLSFLLKGFSMPDFTAEEKEATRYFIQA